MPYWSPYWFVFDSKGTAPILISKQWIKLLSIILFKSPENIDLNSIIEVTETSKINLSTVNRNIRYLCKDQAPQILLKNKTECTKIL